MIILGRRCLTPDYFKSILETNDDMSLIRCLMEDQYPEPEIPNSNILIDGTPLLIWLAEEGYFFLFKSLLQRFGGMLPRPEDLAFIQRLWEVVKKRDSMDEPWIFTLLDYSEMYYEFTKAKLIELGELVPDKIFRFIKTQRSYDLDKWYEGIFNYMSMYPEDTLENFPELRKKLIDTFDNIQSLCDITNAFPSKVSVILRDIILPKLMSDTQDCCWHEDTISKIKHLYTPQEWKTIIKFLTDSHLNNFDIFGLVYKWATMPPDFSKIVDPYIKFFVDQGFAFTGYFGKSNFNDSLKDSYQRLDQKVANAQEHRRPIYAKRVDNYKRYLSHVYADVVTVLDYAEKVSPEIMDALYLYGISSAVVNEPFKREAFTTTQKQLSAGIRRPTAEQHAYISIMDEAIRNAPHTTKGLWMWRGVGVPSIDVVDMDLDIFKSLSLSPNVSASDLREHNCCLLKVRIPPGVPLLPIDPFQQQKSEGGQFEFVLPRGSRLEHTTTYKIGDMNIYECQTIYDPEYEMDLAPGRLRGTKRRLSETYTLDESDAGAIASKVLRKIGPFATVDVNKIKFLFMSHLQHYRAMRIAKNKFTPPEMIQEIFQQVKEKVLSRLNQAQNPSVYQALKEWNLDLQEMYRI